MDKKNKDRPLGEVVDKEEILASKVDLNTPVGAPTSSSTEVSCGGIFFAIRGWSVDGHQFVLEVLKKGVVVVVVEDRAVFDQYPHTVLVTSTRKAFALAACRWCGDPSRQLRVVGITGTNGKTTIGHLLSEVWRAQNILGGMIGTVEHRIGNRALNANLTTPDPLVLQKLFAQMVDQGVTHASVEASSIALDQYRSAGTHFEIGIFTNLSKDHLDYHKNMETYYLSKKRLFTEYDIATGIFNVDDKWGARLFREVALERKISISLENSEAHFSFSKVGLTQATSTGRLKTPEGEVDVSFQLLGRHNLYNILSVVAACSAQGISVKQVVKTLSNAQGAPGRLERVGTPPGGPAVFVDYAHTPDALENVLRLLEEIKKAGRIITVFGCGGDRDKSKRPLMAGVVSSRSDVTVITSDNPRTEDPKTILFDIEAGIQRDQTEYHCEGDRRKAIGIALEIAQKEDIVLVAGKGHETYQIIGTQKMSFDDREVIREYYK